MFSIYKHDNITESLSLFKCKCKNNRYKTLTNRPATDFCKMFKNKVGSFFQIN